MAKRACSITYIDLTEDEDVANLENIPPETNVTTQVEASAGQSAESDCVATVSGKSEVLIQAKRRGRPPKADSKRRKITDPVDATAFASAATEIPHPQLIASSTEAGKLPCPEVTPRASVAFPLPAEVYNFSTSQDSFQCLAELPEIVHDCNESHMRVLLPDLPNATRFVEGSPLPHDVHAYIDFNIPEKLSQWNIISVKNSAEDDAANSPLCSLIPDTCVHKSVQLTQRLFYPVTLPALKGAGWSHVGSLRELKRVVQYAHSIQRMVMVVCSQQNPMWEKTAFNLWAPKYPRLMFASIERNIVNADHDVGKSATTNRSRSF